MAIEVKSASLNGVIKWLIMMGGMSNESNNFRRAKYEVSTRARVGVQYAYMCEVSFLFVPK